MSASSRCYSCGCAFRIFPMRSIKKLNSPSLLSQARLFHASQPTQERNREMRKKRESDMGDIWMRVERVRVDTIERMVIRAYKLLNDLQRLQILLTDNILQRNTRTQNEDSILLLDQYIDLAEIQNGEIKEAIIEILEYKVNYTVAKLRPEPPDRSRDLWLREKFIETWKMRVFEKRGSCEPYLRTDLSSTRHNILVLRFAYMHRSIALLMEAERLKMERSLTRTYELLSLVRRKVGMRGGMLTRPMTDPKPMVYPPPTFRMPLRLKGTPPIGIAPKQVPTGSLIRKIQSD
ncbi:hypothetical protein F4781DRAFT_133395 [Annulohypoxylon bovei var. microspora]|nr:hypothetical protein F4781DRAFT_133395 [Annulohypoxylon bovei var. microspora]